ncbi:hypothetical protein POREN0001_1745 [Porphyromonas endodontalis ATCC 35406]|uniref:Uncharacterized protein n=1 Tax=Porphyromonas endodontalis (strain ATCC 35406 / DSM 24491 / JCM 8526 / CCUG 16442 / BCRC 14492 / NCTC 13058 / HG 370) TaxID=553175 RepID=C3JBL1_POREA|nr:hypothetical protein POREN0001_1745 [Porphyromonas endodontalis ATCC 35406]
MTILLQTFFTLVRCHLVSFSLLTTWHIVSKLKGETYFVYCFW